MFFEHHNPQYHEFEIHNLMLSDKARTETYQRAIKENISPGDIVIDFGTGTGILAIFAAKAGARKVYAIEKTSIIELAKKLAVDNKVEDTIEFIQADARDVELPEKVDVIVSEWFGIFVFQENMLPDLLFLRDRFLKPSGKLLPENTKLFLAPIHAPEAHREIVKKWFEATYDIDLSRLGSNQLRKEHRVILDENNLMASPKKIFELDLYNVTYTSEIIPRMRTTFEIIADASCHGLGGWFTAHFPGKEILDTGPGSLQISWEQTYFPIKDPFPVKKGQKISTWFAATIDKEDKRLARFNWGLSKI